MNNYSLKTADRLTHLKIVVMSLVAGIVVVGVGIAARPNLPDMSTRLEARDRDVVEADFGLTAADLRDGSDRSVVEVAGVVTHRQQPSTAKGTVFLNLEDETGLVNVICSPGVWKRFRAVARGASALRVRGVLERHQHAVRIRIRSAPLPGFAPDGVHRPDSARQRFHLIQVPDDLLLMRDGDAETVQRQILGHGEEIFELAGLDQEWEIARIDAARLERPVVHGG